MKREASGLLNIARERILVIGDINGSAMRLPEESFDCEYRADMLEAVTQATRQNFDYILVSISHAGKNLPAVLRTLKEVSPTARIILLARMYEEPQAIEFVRPGLGRVCFADDYVIALQNTGNLLGAIRPQARNITVSGDNAAELAEKEKTIKLLEKLATEDDLTKVKNRRYVREFLKQIMERAKKEDMQVTLLIFDIDNFKHYNDQYGHAAGDQILQQIAAVVSRCCRKHDIVGRIGGDEFAVVFWDCPADTPKEYKKAKETESERRATRAEHPREVITITQRFQKDLTSTEFSLLGPTGKGVLTISGGLASFPRDGSSDAELFELADKALLDAKRSGKNRIYVVGNPKNDINTAE